MRVQTHNKNTHTTDQIYQNMRKHTCAPRTHTPPPPSSCSLNVDYTRHRGELSPPPPYILLLNPVARRFPHKEAEQDRLTRGAQWPGVGGPERAAAPGPLGWALLPPFPSFPQLYEQHISGWETWAETATARGQLAEEQNTKIKKHTTHLHCRDAVVTLCQVKQRRGRIKLRWFLSDVNLFRRWRLLSSSRISTWGNMFIRSYFLSI